MVLIAPCYDGLMVCCHLELFYRKRMNLVYRDLSNLDIRKCICKMWKICVDECLWIVSIVWLLDAIEIREGWVTVREVHGLEGWKFAGMEGMMDFGNYIVWLGFCILIWKLHWFRSRWERFEFSEWYIV